MPRNECIIDVLDFVIHLQFSPTTACCLSYSFVCQIYKKKINFSRGTTKVSILSNLSGSDLLLASHLLRILKGREEEE
jgi:hypothetical protein